MGVRNAVISRDIFDEEKEYVYPIAQRGPNKPLVDADFNDGWESIATRIQRVMQIFGDGSPNNGFKIEESGVSNVNNFTVKGGDGTLDGAGRITEKGLLCLLKSDVEWNSLLSDADKIHDQSTGLTTTKLTNTGANWNTNELAGRLLVPNTANGTTFTIASNTATEITISAGDMTTVASAGDTYRVEPSTPSGVRTDIVYLDIYLDEIDSDEDTNLKHPLSGGSSFTSCLRNKLKHIVKVRENSSTLPTSPTTDVDGNVHYYVKLATLTRDANNTITASEIADNVVRDIYSIADIRAEVIAARGTAADLDTRLDQSLEENGDLKANTVGSSQITNGAIVNEDVNASADINQTKIGDSDTVDDSFAGVPADLEDDLNEIRTKIKDAKGTTNWDDAVTDTLENVVSEVQTARGTQADLDTRLDVALNEDGSLKPVSVINQVPRLASEPSLLFYPKDGSSTNTYRLHMFRGGFTREYGQANTVNGPYVNLDLSHGSYPLDVVVGAAAGPGGSDNQAASQTFAQKWMYIYLIGKDDGSIALVASDPARTPFGQGPLLDTSSYDFPTNGWKYWKFICAVRNRSAAGWDLVPIRKKGKHCSYEQAHSVQTGGFPVGRTQYSIATRIPPTSMRANLMLDVLIYNGATGILEISPASAVSAGETMLMQDPTPTDPNAMVWKLKADAGHANPSGDIQKDSNTGWCATDDAQRIDITAAWNSTGTAEWEVFVLGYEEFVDQEDSEMSF